MKKLVIVTAWDFPTGKIVDKANIDYILVGDSLAMTILGHMDTKSIKMEEMLHHVRAVKRGVQKTPIIADMPIGSYETISTALGNAKAFLKAGADMVKIEGCKVHITKALIAHNIPVVGHLGLLPQTAKEYKVQGRDIVSARKILKEAITLDNAGVSLIVLECIPIGLAKKITESVNAPTIGIGAGIHCKGQVLVLADMIGLSEFKGKMVKQYIFLKEEIAKAVSLFKNDVRKEEFPGKEHSFQ
jgi:3-methyl-2-oxobutanoate hydroxymethyltransferase